MIGKTISHYEILDELGRGGMGVVYRARDVRLDRTVALKFLPRHLSMEKEARARFTREARTASALDHPNICTIFEIGEHEEQTFIAMAYYEGETLKDKIERGPLDLDKAVDYAMQIADGLAQSHNRKIVHRDVKPANVFVTNEGRVKLLDFGLAKAVEQTQLTREGVTPGTIAYMSPEQVRGEAIDGRADLWALGAVLHEMLCGERPFRGVYDQAIIYVILNESPGAMSGPGEDIPEALERIVLRLLEKDPVARYQTAEELLNDLDDLNGSGGLDAGRSRVDSELSISSDREAPEHIAEAGSEKVSVEGIAVLPFETLGRSESTPFTEGIHGDVLTRLSRILELRVISRTSVRQYRNTEKTIPEIARELGVRWVLEGDVQEAASQVRVTARLVEALQDRQVWSQDYQDQLTAENIFQIQGEITKKIVGSLEVQLSPEEKERIDHVPTKNLDAYRLCVQGREFLNERTEKGMRRAVELFQRSIEKDSGYARAWVGRADALALLFDYGYETSIEALSSAKEAAKEALKRDPLSAEAYASLGLIRSTRHDGPGAIRDLRRAVELQPNYADAHNWLAWVFLILGRSEEARQSARRSMELNPLSPEAVSNAALADIACGDSESALSEARQVTKLQESWTTGQFYEGLALYELSRYGESITVLKNLTVEWAGSGPRLTLALARIATGNLGEARSLLVDFERANDPFAAGVLYAAIGATDLAFDALQRTRNWNAWRSLAARFLFRRIWKPLENDSRYLDMIAEIDRVWNDNSSS